MGRQDKLTAFVEMAIREGKKMMVLEIGCGFNTPVVTRYPAESIAREAAAPMVRVNLTDCDAPEQLPAFIGLPMDTTDALRKILTAIKSQGYSQVRWPAQQRASRWEWRQMLRNLQDPPRRDQYPAVHDW